MKIFLTIAAILAWAFGAGLLFATRGFYAPMGITLTPLLATMGQAHGATLVGLGVVNWLARGLDRRAAIPVLGGNLVVQALSLAVALRLVQLVGAGAAPAIVIHVGLGTGFAVFLARALRKEG